MAKQLTMPALSPSMTEGSLVKWLKKEGDTIKPGDVIAEVETDKATMDLESFDSGTILKIVAKEGSQVTVNGVVAVIGKPGEKVDDALLAAAPAAKPAPVAQPSAVDAVAASTPAPAVVPIHTPTPSFTSAPSSNGGRVKASPLAKKIAREMGVNLTGLAGTGPGGRIVKRDVQGGAGGGSSMSLHGNGPIAEEKRVALSNMRKTIAKRLLESKTQIPHFYLEIEIDVEPLAKARASLNAILEKQAKPSKVSVNDFILKACAIGLRKVPVINSSFEGDAIRQFSAVHMSFAVAIPDGLITPVIRDAHQKSLAQIAQEAKSLGARAKEGALKPEEYTGGTFTVSNLGMMGIDRFSAIINPPQAAILAVGATVKKPVVNAQDQIVVGQRMSLVLSCDHRVVDGATGATFLNELKALLENPALLFV